MQFWRNLMLLVAALGMLAVSSAHGGAPTTEELSKMLLTLNAQVELLHEQNAALRDELDRVKVKLDLTQEKIADYEIGTTGNYAQINGKIKTEPGLAIIPAAQGGSSAVDSTPSSNEHNGRQIAVLDNGEAEAGSDWYIAASLSGLLIEDVTIDGSEQSSETAKAILDPGFGITTAVGNQVLPWLRFEGEASYRHAGINTFKNITAPAQTSASGYADVYTLFGNAYLDAPNAWRITPYIGAGAGVFLASVTGNSKSLTSVNDGGMGPVFQLMAGAAYELNPDWDLTLGYRHLLFPDASMRDSRLVKGDAETVGVHEIGVGVRRNF